MRNYYAPATSLDWNIVDEGSALEGYGSQFTQDLGLEVGNNGAVVIRNNEAGVSLVFEDINDALDELKQLVEVLEERVNA